VLGAVAVVGVEDQLGDHGADEDDQTCGESRQHEDESSQGIGKVEAGGNKEPHQTKDRTHRTSK